MILEGVGDGVTGIILFLVSVGVGVGVWDNVGVGVGVIPKHKMQAPILEYPSNDEDNIIVLLPIMFTLTPT